MTESNAIGIGGCLSHEESKKVLEERRIKALKRQDRQLIKDLKLKVFCNKCERYDMFLGSVSFTVKHLYKITLCPVCASEVYSKYCAGAQKLDEARRIYKESILNEIEDRKGHKE